MTIFRRYGEERYAKQIARAIVRRRREQPFERTGELVDTIKAAIPAPARFGEGHPAKRVFQALRIAVNDELDSLASALPAALEMLRPGGRLAVISFHSLEDRIVKRFLRERERGCTCPPDFPVCVCGHEPELRALQRRPDPPRPGRARGEPALGVGAPARRGQDRSGEGLMAAVDWFAPAEVAEPRTGSAAAAGARRRPAAPVRSRRKATPPRPRPHRLDGPLRAPARRRRRGQRRRAAGARRRHRSSTRSARSSRRGTRRSPPRSRPPTPRRGSRRPRARLGFVQASAGNTSYLDLDSRRPLKTRVVNSRLRLLLLVILLTFAALGARAAWLQTVRASSLAAMAQTQAKKPISLPAGRGTIYDRLGNPLAIGEQAIDVIADPMQISDPRREARIAAKVLGIPVRPLYRAALRPQQGLRLRPAEGAAEARGEAREAHLIGFTFQPDQRRVYPQGTVAAPVLGYAGTDNTGLSGLELELNRELEGDAGSGDGRPGRARPGRRTRSRSVPLATAGTSILTLDSHIQANAEQVLEQTVQQWHAKDATAIVLDPRTGAILAMAQEPGYNANGYPAAYAHGLTVDHAVNDVFEPGSVFKVVTIGGALSQHDITPNTAFTGSRLAPRRRPRDPRRGAARDRDAERLADPPALVEHRHGPDRRAATSARAA